MTDSHPPPLGPQTADEAAFLEAYCELDEADRVMVWSAILTEVGRRSNPEPDEGPAKMEESCP